MKEDLSKFTEKLFREIQQPGLYVMPLATGGGKSYTIGKLACCYYPKFFRRIVILTIQKKLSLEMQAQLETREAKDLYGFWGNSIADSLFGESRCVLNLASREYSRSVSLYLPEGAAFITCVFAEWKSGKLVEKGTMCKMARGQMLRWMAENDITNPADIRNFNDLEYRFSPEHSSENNYVFIKGEKRDA